MACCCWCSAKEAAFLKNLFYELTIDCPRDVPLRCDNQSTIKQSLNQVDQRRCRHLGMKTHFLRQQCHAGHLSLSYVPSASQKGDIFTKCLPTAQHEPMRRSLNVMTVHEFMQIYDSPGKLDSTIQSRHWTVFVTYVSVCGGVLVYIYRVSLNQPYRLYMRLC